MYFNDADPNWAKDEKITSIQASEKINRTEIERKKIDIRAKHTNLARRLHAQRIEDEFFDSYKTEEENQRRYLAKVRKDVLLAKGIDKERDEEIRNIKMRQLLRENTAELRDLEAKLRTAYVNKELAAQMAEKQYLKVAERKHELECGEALRKAMFSNLEAERIEKEEDIRNKFQYRKDLQDQMILNYQMKQNAYEEFLREKKILDNIIQQIYDEDQREMEFKLCKMNKTKAEIQAFKEAQSIWKEKERKEQEEENRRIEEYAIRQAEIEKQKKIEKQLIEAAREKNTDALARHIYAADKERTERQQLIQDLHEEELKEKEEQRVKDEIKRAVQKQIETLDILNIQKEERQKKQEQEVYEDKQYRQQILAKIAADEKLEQMSANNRRLKMIQMRKELEETMKERRALRAEELKRQLYFDEQDKIAEDQKRKIIEEERLRMLKEHAVNLLGYLPPGVLRKDDLPLLGSEVLEQYSSKTH